MDANGYGDNHRDTDNAEESNKLQAQNSSGSIVDSVFCSIFRMRVSISRPKGGGSMVPCTLTGVDRP